MEKIVILTKQISNSCQSESGSHGGCFQPALQIARQCMGWAHALIFLSGALFSCLTNTKSLYPVTSVSFFISLLGAFASLFTNL